MLNVLKVQEGGGKLMDGVKALFRGRSACDGVKQQEVPEYMEGYEEGCLMSSWLFSVFMGGVIREMEAGDW